MNYQSGDYCHINHGGNDNISNSTRSKRRAIEDATPPPPNQASTLDVAPHVPVTSAQPNVATQQR